MILEFAAIVALVAVVAYNVTNQAIFAWLRDAVTQRTQGTRLSKLQKLISCHYCFSHWAAASIVAVTQFRIHLTGGCCDWALTWALVVVAAQPVMVALDWTIDLMNSFEKLFVKANQKVPVPSAGVVVREVEDLIGHNGREDRVLLSR